MKEPPITGASERETIEAIRELIRGRGNYVTIVTLTPNAATTVIQNRNFNANGLVVLSPTTANAAAALSTTYAANVSGGSVTLAHANNAQTDRTFKMAVLGG